MARIMRAYRHFYNYCHHHSLYHFNVFVFFPPFVFITGRMPLLDFSTRLYIFNKRWYWIKLNLEVFWSLIFSSICFINKFPISSFHLMNLFLPIQYSIFSFSYHFILISSLFLSFFSVLNSSILQIYYFPSLFFCFWFYNRRHFSVLSFHLLFHIF